MQVHRYTSAAEMLPLVQEFLEREEATNNLPLGLLHRFARDPASVGEQRPLFALAKEHGGVALVMVMTPPYNLILYGQEPGLDRAIEAATTFLDREQIPLPGVTGPRELAERFAAAWSLQTGCTTCVEMEQMIYRLDRVEPVPASPGQLIQAGEEHLDLVAEWLVAFSQVTPNAVSPKGAQERAAKAVRSGQVYLWLDGMPVSMAWRNRPMRHSIAVGAVYTPPELRGRGYATSCVAALSRLLLDEGYAFCSLYTDLANPTSNRIYQKIGYRPVQASAMIQFG